MTSRIIKVYKNEVDCLVRDKTITYFEESSKISKNSDLMRMKHTQKDASGHSFNPINRKLYGMFFMVRTSYQMECLNKSYFGNKRFIGSPLEMLRDKNLYFADFYCMKRRYSGDTPLNKRTHYVQLVVTRPGSPADRACTEEYKLIQLDVHGNPFLWFEDGRLFTHQMGRKDDIGYSDVELLYTEDVEFTMDDITDVVPFNSYNFGASSNGLPSLPNCEVCDLNVKWGEYHLESLQ